MSPTEGLQRRRASVPEMSGVKLGKICGDEGFPIVLLRQRYTSYNPNLKIGDYVVITDSRTSTRYMGVIVGESNVSMYEDESSIRASIAHHDDITPTERDIYIAKEWKIKVLGTLSNGTFIAPADKLPYRLSEVSYPNTKDWEEFLGELLLTNPDQESLHLGSLMVGSKALPIQLRLPNSFMRRRTLFLISYRELLSREAPVMRKLSQLGKLGYNLTPIMSLRDMRDILGGLSVIANPNREASPGEMSSSNIAVSLLEDLRDNFTALRVTSSYLSLVLVLTDSIPNYLMDVFHVKLISRGAVPYISGLDALPGGSLRDDELLLQLEELHPFKLKLDV